jgi:hypothetical protein
MSTIAYVATWNTMWFWYGAFVAGSGKERRPRFALLPESHTMLVSLSEHADLFTRNEAARELVATWCTKCAETGIDAPTYMMLRSFCECAALESDVLPPEEVTDRLVPPKPGQA